MPRPCHCRMVENLPTASCFAPQKVDGAPLVQGEECLLAIDGYEALRLADYEDLNMDEGAARMGVSRHTFGRLLRRARRCVAQALIEGRPLRIEGGVCALVDKDAVPELSEEGASVLVAVPSEAPGGLDATLSSHFGHCQMYTLARIRQGAVRQLRIQPNAGHERGNCLQPVHELQAAGVTVLLSSGMGLRPLQAMQEAGITVYHNAGESTVRQALTAFMEGRLQPFGKSDICRAGPCATVAQA